MTYNGGFGLLPFYPIIPLLGGLLWIYPDYRVRWLKKFHWPTEKADFLIF